MSIRGVALDTPFFSFFFFSFFFLRGGGGYKWSGRFCYAFHLNLPFVIVLRLACLILMPCQ